MDKALTNTAAICGYRRGLWLARSFRWTVPRLPVFRKSHQPVTRSIGCSCARKDFYLGQRDDACFTLAVGLRHASTEMPRCQRALAALYQALGSLRESTANKGGHRARAMDLVRDAITQTQAVVEFADEHGGGGQ